MSTAPLGPADLPADGPADSPTGAPDLGLLSELAPQLAQTFVSIASDIALVIDDGGIIRNIAQGAEPVTGDTHEWVGRAWTDTVTGETRRKVEQLLTEARGGGVAQRREVNHPGRSGHDVAVAYAAVRLGRHGPVLAVGRNLRAVTAIQKRFIDAQHEMERDYWRQRQAESRYRMLFQVATDGVMVVEAESLKVVEANRAATRLFGVAPDALQGRAATAGLSPLSRPAVEELFVTARTLGRPGEIRAWVAGPPGAPDASGAIERAVAVDLSATPFSAEGALLLLVRVRPAEPVAELSVSGPRLADFVERTPDAVVITDSQGYVLMANPAFSALCSELAHRSDPAPRNPVGQRLVGLLGDPGGELPAILAEARRQGIAEQRLAVVGRGNGGSLDVEISAALLAEGDQECLGLTLRRVDTRTALLPPQVGELAKAIDRLAEQVGLVPLPDLLRETSELAERHLIEATLVRSQGDRLQAAQLLGISAENLWMRMRHHGLDTLRSPDGMAPGLLN